MPPTLITIAFGLLIGVALLGAAFDRRSLAIVALAAALPDVDALLSLVIPGATNALLHSILIPAGAAALIYYDTAVRDDSWLRSRWGWYGVRVAWVAVAAYAVAGIGLDLFSSEAVALAYPISGRYVAIEGRFVLSTQSGITQTYIEFADGWFVVDSPGTTATHHVGSWFNPVGDEQRLRFVETGWQAVVLVTALIAVPAKWLVERSDR